MKRKKFKMPSAYTIVGIALVFTAILSYFIPQSVFDKTTGEITFNAIFGPDNAILKGEGMTPFGIWDVLIAPIKGFQAASNVGVGILVAGGFLGVLNHTGALEAGIGQLLTKFKGALLVAIMMFVFAILGTSFGFWEEITAFAVVVIPMFVLAGYDVMTGLAVLFIGASVGNMASIVNPFSTGAAVSAIGNPELSLGSGIVLRVVLFFVLYAVATFFVIRYANSVKKDPKKSVLDGQNVETLIDQKAEMPEYTKARKYSVYVFITQVILMIVGYFPWLELTGEKGFNFVNAPVQFLAKIPVLGNILGAANITPFGEWYFNEFAFLFLAGAIILKLINKMPEMEFIDTFLNGMKEFWGVVVILSIAKGIAILMGDASQGMSITFIYWISNALSSVPLWVFGIFAMGAYILIGLFLQSTSGVAGISMPILGAVASALFVGSTLGAAGGQIILISSFTLGVNFMSAVYPGATVMGTLELVKVPYDQYLKFTLKILLIVLAVGAIVISVAPYLGLVQ